jgi:hypothetical protein
MPSVVVVLYNGGGVYTVLVSSWKIWPFPTSLSLL